MKQLPYYLPDQDYDHHHYFSRKSNYYMPKYFKRNDYKKNIEKKDKQKKVLTSLIFM